MTGTRRLLLKMAAALLTATAVVVAADAVFAQPVPLPGAPGLDQLLADPGRWLTEMFNAAVLAVGGQATGDLVQFMTSFGNGAIVFRTPPELTYDNGPVIHLAELMKRAANAALVVIIVIGGVNMVVHPYIRAPYHGALEVIPRVLLGAVMVNTSLGLGKFAIDLNNALCQMVTGAAMPDWNTIGQLPSDGSVLLNMIAIGVYLVMGMLLVGQMLMRLALVDALLVIAPLALLCWVLPQTYAWARLWFTTFFGTVFVQCIQVLVLGLGADLMQSLVPLLSTFSSGPLTAAHTWLITLLLGMAVLQLARKIPRLMQGVPAGMGSAYAGPSITQVANLFNSGGNRKGSK
jgi:hypothetical protein